MESKTWDDALISEIAGKIQNKLTGKKQDSMIVPVIGDEVFFVEDNAERVPIQAYITRQIWENNLKGKAPYNDSYEHGFRGYNLLAKDIKKLGGNFLGCLISVVTGCKERIMVDPDVLEFLISGEFPLIITTSIYGVLEKHLKNYEVRTYIKEKCDEHDISLAAESRYEQRIAKPTIYCLFGQLNWYLPSVVTENDFLSYLYSLLDTSSHPVSLKKYLTTRSVFMLGCDLPDWTFRFLLFSLKHERGELKESSGDINSFSGGSLSGNIDSELERFLSDIKYHSCNRVSEFLRDINAKLNPETKPRLFLSCYSQDYETEALGVIKERLSERFDVWFCPEQVKGLGGEQYWRKIKGGMETSQLFMPVVTDRLTLKLAKVKALSAEPDPDNEPGIITEWKLALKYDCSKNTIPYILTDFDDLKDYLNDNLKPVRELFLPQSGAQAILKPVSEFDPNKDIILNDSNE